MKKTNDKFYVSLSDMENFIWMSLKYSIGRHLEASHAETIRKLLYDWQKRKNDTHDLFQKIVQFIRLELNKNLAAYHNIDITYEHGDNIIDAYSLLFDYCHDNWPEGISRDFFGDHKATIDVCSHIVTVNEVEPKPSAGTPFLFFLMNNACLPWIKLANMLDSTTHKNITINGEEKKVYPFYEISSNNNKKIIRKLWVNADLSCPINITQYYSPDFFDNPNDLK